jgi:hypothetical protein
MANVVTGKLDVRQAMHRLPDSGDVLKLPDYSEDVTPGDGLGAAENLDAPIPIE